MKKIILSLGFALVFCVNVSSYTTNVHKYIVEQAYELLKAETCYGYEEYDLGIYCYDENWDPAIVKGVIEEDVFDWVYHYHLLDPQFNQVLTNDILQLLRQAAGNVDFLGVEGPSFMPTVTHFWNADSGIDNNTFLHGEMACFYWSLYTSNAYTKAKRYFEGNENNDPYWITAPIHAIPIQDVFDYPYPQLTYPYVYSEPYSINNLSQNGTTRLYDCLSNLDKGDLITEPTSTFHFNENYKKHLSLRILGKILHLLADMSVPAHVHNDEHAPRKYTVTGSWHTSFCDQYEGWLDDEDKDIDAGGFMAFEVNWYWDYYNTLNQKGGFIDIANQDDPLLYIMYTVNQIADFFASDDVDGDSNLPQGSNSIINAMYSELETLYPPDHPIRNSHEMTTDESAQIRDNVFPFLIRATAGVLKWFAEENNLTQILVYPLPNIVSGNVSLDGGSGDITSVSIKFDPQSYGINNVYLNPDENGNFSHVFNSNEFDTYDVTYELYSATGDYYLVPINDVVINEYTAPLTLPDVTLHPITDPTNINVSIDENIPAFQYIQDAVDYLSAHNSGTINIFPGTYTGDRNKNIWWSPNALLYPEELHITIRGIGECIIDCEESGIAFKFDNEYGYFQYNENDIIDNLTIINAEQGIVIEHGSPVIKNNTIENCVLPYDPDYTHGAGISCKSSATIENNIIRNNVGHWVSDEEDWTFGGGIYIENNTSNTTFIKNNLISGNSAYNGGGIYCTGSGVIILDGNEITENTLVEGSGSFEWPEYGTGICCENANIIYAKNNFIHDNYPYSDNGESLSISCNDAVIENNTVIDNLLDSGIVLDITSSAVIRNNIVSNNKRGIYKYSGIPVTVNYSCVSNNEIYNYDTGVTKGEGCLEEDVDPLLNVDGEPLWNSTTKSPCIDTGNPTIIDDDDTPSDIGAVRAIDHTIDTVVLFDAAEGINWKCFPVLDDVYAEEDIAANVLYDVMQLPIPAALEYVETQGGENDITNNGEEWFNDEQEFTSVKGYKLKMNEASTLEITGFTEEPEQTIYLEAGGENWLGYFLEGSMNPFDALEAVLDKINRITTRTFTYIKLEDDSWLGVGNEPKKPTINYGDLVIVNCTVNGSFFWGQDGGGTVPKETRSSSQDFTYEEETEYIPVFVELDLEALDNPTEIAIFVEDECKGAEVIEDTLVQIRAYVFNDTVAFDPGSVEFQLSYGSRSENTQIDSYTLKENPDDPGRKGQFDFSETQNSYYIVSLSDPENNVPEIIMTTLEQNYPNPFNPSTTIAYSIQNNGLIELNVYNIKGQFVKTLVKGEQQTGSYEVVWNGKDNNEKNIASGVYFYKLSIKDETIMKKMLMLK